MGQRSGYTSSGRNGLDKARKFAEYVRPFGWEVKYSQDDETGVVYLFARRGELETLEIWWQPIGSGATTKDAMPKYTLAGQARKLLNVSACVSVATKDADMSKVGKTMRKQRRRVDRVNVAIRSHDVDSLLSDDETAGVATLPAPLVSVGSIALRPDQLASDASVRAAISGRTIEWVNSQSGQIELAEVMKIKKIVRNGHDYVDFIDSRGFHSVYLDKIVSVR